MYSRVLSLCVCLLLAISFSSCASGSGSSYSSPPPPPPPPPTPSYSLAAGGLSSNSVTAGTSTSSTITLTPTGGYQGTVSLSCAITGGTTLPACSFSDNPVSVGGSGGNTSTLTISSTSSTPGGAYTVTVSAVDAKNLAPSDGAQTLTLTMSAVIEHIVVIFQENRSTDNMFQDPVLIAHGADIASSGVNSLGQTIQLTSSDLGTKGTNPQMYDLGHTYYDFLSMYDKGKMDGADKVSCYPPTYCPPNANPNPSFRYVIQSDVQPYLDMAEQYTFGDRMFQTNEGPSFPAHLFLISGTSAPTATSTLFASENPNSIPYGCLAPPTETVIMIDANGQMAPPQYPCFEHPTLIDLMDAAGVSWKYYTPSAGGFWTSPNAIEHICQPQTINGTLTCTGPDWTNVVVPQTQVLTDIANGQLAGVSWVIPTGASSDHSDSNTGTGPSWVSSIVNAIGNSPYWSNTAIFITWDDWGGWYDHVAPKVINDGVSWGSGYVYGFRVPLIVVSPYAKAQYISHTTHDFGSILKFIESTYNLPSLGYADAYADDMSDCFIFTQAPTIFHAIHAPLNAAHFINDNSPPTDPDDD